MDGPIAKAAFMRVKNLTVDLSNASTVSSVNGYSGIVTLTKSDIGLGMVNNTTDLNKPISTATQTALDACVQTSVVGEASGVASLDSTGVLTEDEIPDSLKSGLTYQSSIDVTSATVDDASSDNVGWFYRNNTAGTSDITGTSETWAVNDWLVSTGSEWQHWEMSIDNATTTSTGVIELAGDLGGTATEPTVTGIQGVTVDDTDIADGSVLSYDSTSKTIVYVSSGSHAYGDVKDSYQTADHDGWVLADGRAITDLTTTQQNVASDTLGFSSTIPDLQNVFILGAGDDYDLAESGGSFTIDIANLPKTNIASSKSVTVKPVGTVSTTTTSTASSSCSSTYPFGSNWYAVTTYGSQTMYSDEGGAISGEDNAYIQLSKDIPDSYISSNRAYHSHTVSTSVDSSSTSTFTGTSTSYSLPTMYVNGGVTQTAYHQPYVALNRFIYLGA